MLLARAQKTRGMAGVDVPPSHHLVHSLRLTCGRHFCWLTSSYKITLTRLLLYA
jgi:hypothetical protein